MAGAMIDCSPFDLCLSAAPADDWRFVSSAMEDSLLGVPNPGTAAVDRLIGRACSAGRGPPVSDTQRTLLALLLAASPFGRAKPNVDELVASDDIDAPGAESAFHSLCGALGVGLVVQKGITSRVVRTCEGANVWVARGSAGWTPVPWCLSPLPCDAIKQLMLARETTYNKAD